MIRLLIFLSAISGLIVNAQADDRPSSEVAIAASNSKGSGVMSRKFLSLPIPKAIWDKAKLVQNDDFVNFVKSCRNWK